MWIANTAAAAMMLPIMDSVLQEMEKKEEQSNAKDQDVETNEKDSSSLDIKRFRAMLCMSIAWSANIGGTSSLIGTPPNLQLLEVLDDFEGHPITFLSWMVMAVPQAISAHYIFIM
jgi:sodium-dependent dicarboxylate transporter 2/3/5